jgi:hypothetical protein
VEAGAGLILSANSVDSAARDVARALRDRRWLDQTGRAARELAKRRFNRDVLAADLARVLTEACGQPR